MLRREKGERQLPPDPLAPTAPEISEVLADLRRHLAWQEAEGGPVLLVEAPVAKAAGSASRPASPQPSAPAFPAPTAKPAAAKTSGVAKPAAAKTPGPPKSVSDLAPVSAYSEADRTPLDHIRQELGDCQRCKLCSGRKNIVFGVGNPRAQLVFVGEGPGMEEDAQGVPFVGEAGQLLNKMIEAMGFSRDEVYLCNVVKCRPPESRSTPQIDEIAACEPFLRAQLASIQPKVIVGLGKTAVQTMLRDDVSITHVRGVWTEYAGIKLMPTFHPAYLLRRPEEKKKVWSDLQQVMKLFGKEPKRS